MEEEQTIAPGKKILIGHRRAIGELSLYLTTPDKETKWTRKRKEIENGTLVIVNLFHQRTRRSKWRETARRDSITD